MSGKVFYTLGGFRGLWTDHYNGAEHIGFRLNGVTRGGVYSSFADRSLCSYRGYWGNTLDNVSVGRGFLWGVKGVMRGGSYRAILTAYRFRSCFRGNEWDRLQNRAYVGFL